MRNWFWIVIFLNSLFWLILVPIWQTPDEQIHFGQATFVSEKWRNPQGPEIDYSAEIDQSTVFLGTQRDKFGNNKFTHHPEYKIEYSDSIKGVHEAEISALKNTPARNTFVKKESSRYPPFYYFLTAVVLKLFSFTDLFTRVFAVRFFNLGIFMVSLYVFWLWAKKIFKNQTLLSQTLVLLIGFQPMLIFSSIGVTSDTLGNLIFAGYIYFMTLLVIDGLPNKRNIFWFIFLTLLAPLIKPQFIISIPLSLMFLTGFLIFKYRQKSIKPILGVIILGSLIFILFMKINLGPATALTNLKGNFSLSSLVKYTWEYTLAHTYREVLPWYWGVYKWLGVTYPRVVHRVINRLLILAIFGFGIWLVKNLRAKNKDHFFSLTIILGLLAAVFYGSLTVYDWLSWSMTNYQLGIQGRYLFPTIGIHMLIILIGWQALFPVNFKTIAVKFLGWFILALNIYALYTVADTYYDLSTFSTFIKQASQYKPVFAKGIFLIGYVLIWIIFLLLFLINYAKMRSLGQPYGERPRTA